MRLVMLFPFIKFVVKNEKEGLGDGGGKNSVATAPPENRHENVNKKPYLKFF